MPDGLTGLAPIRMLLTTDAVGGVWRYSLDLASRMTPRPTVAVLGPAPSRGRRDEAAELGIRLIETGLALDWTAADPAELDAVSLQLQGLAEREGVSSVHLHAPALAGSRRWGMPVVAVAHSCVATWWAAVRGGELPPDFGWRTDATRAGLRTADAVIAPTRAHAEAVKRAYGMMPITVVHNGIAVQEPCPAGGRGLGEGGLPVQSVGRPHAHPVPLPPAGQGVVEGAVLTAGRLWDDAKNAAALDRAALALDAPIRAAGPITGPNGAHAHLPNLHLLGTLDAPDMRRAYAEATVFASLARYEPFGLSVLEAAQAGLHLVLADIPTFRELWDGVARFVALDADPVPALRAALADTGDSGAAERAGHYTLTKTVDQTLAVHRHLLVRA